MLIPKLVAPILLHCGDAVGLDELRWCVRHRGINNDNAPNDTRRDGALGVELPVGAVELRLVAVLLVQLEKALRAPHLRPQVIEVKVVRNGEWRHRRRVLLIVLRLWGAEVVGLDGAPQILVVELGEEIFGVRGVEVQRICLRHLLLVADCRSGEGGGTKGKRRGMR